MILRPLNSCTALPGAGVDDGNEFNGGRPRLYNGRQHAGSKKAGLPPEKVDAPGQPAYHQF